MVIKLFRIPVAFFPLGIVNYGVSWFNPLPFRRAVGSRFSYFVFTGSDCFPDFVSARLDFRPMTPDRRFLPFFFFSLRLTEKSPSFNLHSSPAAGRNHSVEPIPVTHRPQTRSRGLFYPPPCHSSLSPLYLSTQLRPDVSRVMPLELNHSLRPFSQHLLGYFARR